MLFMLIPEQIIAISPMWCLHSVIFLAIHVDRRVVGWSAGRDVDHPCGGGANFVMACWKK